VQPQVTIIMTVSLSDDYSSGLLGDAPVITLQRTVSSGVYGEVVRMNKLLASTKIMKISMNKTPAYSLVFAFLIMTVIMLVAGTTIENTHDKVIYFREIEGTAQARLAAESAAELAVIGDTRRGARL